MQRAVTETRGIRTNLQRHILNWSDLIVLIHGIVRSAIMRMTGIIPPSWVRSQIVLKQPLLLEYSAKNSSIFHGKVILSGTNYHPSTRSIALWRNRQPDTLYPWRTKQPSTNTRNLFCNNYLERAHQRFIDAHHCSCIIELAAVIWRGKQCHQLPFRKEFIPIFHDLKICGMVVLVDLIPTARLTHWQRGQLYSVTSILPH